VSEQVGPVCPECGTARAADGTPACACARRASEAHRAERTAEAAAAEDFDPVRIRPFVEFGAEPDAESGPADDPPADVSAEDRPGPAPSEAHDGDGGGDGVGHGLARRDPVDSTGRRRGRRTWLAAGLAAAAATALTGCLVSGLLWYDSPERDGSLSGGVRAGLPDEDPSAGGPSPSGSSWSASPTQPSASSSASATASSTAGPTRPTASTTPTETASGAAPTATGPAPSASGGRPPVLRYGDQGPEVTELQLRLRQIGFYGGEADGTYTRQVESSVRGYQVTRVLLDDESGVYGATTRASLESETSEP
jgi:hypothetical protein